MRALKQIACKLSNYVKDLSDSRGSVLEGEYQVFGVQFEFLQAHFLQLFFH